MKNYLVILLVTVALTASASRSCVQRYVRQCQTTICTVSDNTRCDEMCAYFGTLPLPRV